MGFDDAFWDGVLARVKPILGDVRQKFGEFWIDPLAACFARPDWWAIRMAARTGGKVPHWYVLEWHEAALEITRDDDYLVAGESREECLAHLADRCTFDGVWPTSFAYQQDDDRTSFTLGDMPFAVIRPVAAPGTVDERTRSRVESTLLGLGKGLSQQAEFERRLAKWPGLANICSESFPLPQKAVCHWPCPSEWLASARMLLDAAGLANAGTAHAQALAAAAFGFKSWMHLCGLVPSSAHKSAWWSMCTPYYVHGEDASDHATIRVYQDAVEGFLDLQSRASLACERQRGVEVSYSSTLIGLPCISLQSPPPPPSPEWAVPLQDTLVCLSPVNSAEYEDSSMARVLTATKDGYVRGLSRLFMIDEPVEDKRKRRAAQRGHVDVAFDGPWHFYVREKPGPAAFFAELFREDGRKIGATGFSVHKGAILWDSDVDGFILTSEYHGRKPVAILRGLSAATIAQIRKALPESELEQRIYRPASAKPITVNLITQRRAQEDARQLARLMALMTPAGSVLR